MTGVNRLWIRFFLLAVYATMYVRDHSRHALHDAMALNTTDYDYRVFEITSEITKQVFPFTLDIDHPKFRAGLERMSALAEKSAAAKARGGIGGALTRAACAVGAALTFARLYTLPVVPNTVPMQVRMSPAW